MLLMFKIAKVLGPEIKMDEPKLKPPHVEVPLLVGVGGGGGSFLRIIFSNY